MKKKAVFLDRDGNINVDVGYPNSVDQIDIYPYSYEAVHKINQAGLLAVIITNQSGVGRGLIQEKDLDVIHNHMRRAFARHDAYFDGVYYCPHYPESDLPEYKKECSCRKPFPGMGYQAAADLSIDTSRSYMVGDKVEDILFGQNIQAQSILVLTGYGKRSLPALQAQNIKPAFVAKDLLEAVNWILTIEEKSR